MRVDGQQSCRVGAIHFIKRVNPTVLIGIPKWGPVVVPSGIDEAQHLVGHGDRAVEVPLAIKRFGELFAGRGLARTRLAGEEDIDVIAVRIPRLRHLEKQREVVMDRPVNVLGFAAWRDQLHPGDRPDQLF
jgi:hypothetical protein